MSSSEQETFIHELLKTLLDEVSSLKERIGSIEAKLERNSGFLSGVAFTAAGIGGFFVWAMDNASQFVNWLTRGSTP
jgi:hypothetical protein